MPDGSRDPQPLIGELRGWASALTNRSAAPRRPAPSPAGWAGPEESPPHCGESGGGPGAAEGELIPGGRGAGGGVTESWCRSLSYVREVKQTQNSA